MAADQPIRDALATLLAGSALGETQAEQVFEAILSGDADDAQVGALLALIQQRQPTNGELTGAARVMRQRVTPVPFTPQDGEALIDTCGTGGAPKTFNVSTAAAIVAAASTPSASSGLKRVIVAKHGNRSRTGRGSAEVLARLGVNLDATPQQQAACLREAGLCFCFAIQHHPAMRHVAGPRRSLGFPTIFNLLGPLSNPAGADRQLIGVYRPEFVPLVAQTLARLGGRRAMVAHAHDGLDELSINAPTRVAHIRSGEIATEDIEPQTLGIEPCDPDEITARDDTESADMITRLLDGEPGPRREMVALNAAAALVVADAAESIADALPLAADAIDSGRAASTLEALVEWSHRDA